MEICCQRAFRAMKMCQIRASMFHRCYSVKSVEKEKKVGGDDSYNGDREIVDRHRDTEIGKNAITAYRLNFPRFVVLELFQNFLTIVN